MFAPIAIWAIVNLPVRVMTVDGPSMSPFLNPNSANGDLPLEKQRILVTDLKFKTMMSISAKPKRLDVVVEGTTLKRGEVVVFTSPTDPTRRAIKRIVGIPGDRVQPLKGYAGGDEPVVVPYHHIWVEGDVGDRNKSFDSNWYGPVSAHLVIGRFAAVLTRFWTPTWIDISPRDDYPAKREGRVEHSVVQQAMQHPDNANRTMAFSDGTVQKELDMMKADFGRVLKMLDTSSESRRVALNQYRSARAELLRDDPGTRDLARELVQVLEDAMTIAGYDRKDLRENAHPTWVAEDSLASWKEQETTLRRQGSAGNQ
jgi:signal peptidase I